MLSMSFIVDSADILPRFNMEMGRGGYVRGKRMRAERAENERQKKVTVHSRVVDEHTPSASGFKSSSSSFYLVRLHPPFLRSQNHPPGRS
jgi:hypothetical protein